MSFTPWEKIAGAATVTGIGLGQTIAGAVKKKKAEKQLAGLQRPIYSRPEEITELGNMAALRVLNPELPGGRILEGEIEQSTATAITAAKDFGSATDIYGIIARENQAKNQLAVQAAQQRVANENRFQDVLQLLGQYSDQEFDYNINLPFQEKREQLMQKMKQGQEQVKTGLNSLSAMGASMMGGSMSGGGKGGEGGGGGMDMGAISGMIGSFGG